MMKVSFLIFLVSFVVTISASVSFDRMIENEWENFKDKNNKNYHKEEDEMRKGIFATNAQNVIAHNNNRSNSYVQTVNEFTAMSDEEQASYLGTVIDESDIDREEWSPRGVMTRDVPTSIDYRDHMCLPAVKNQGSCGSCWAFTAITPLEFSRCKKNNKKVLLSEQQLVDCHPRHKGCNGGWYTTAWSYLGDGSNKLKKYGPYTAKQGECVFQKKFIGARVKSYVKVDKNPDAMMEALVEIGPLAVAIRVAGGFGSYKEGIFSSDSCQGRINHGVVIVGYGTMSGVPYWIVRNSWGPGWGNGGYILMKKGVNMCEIETRPAAVYAK